MVEENYTYDDLNRIKTITGDNQNITYYYDELGNVTQKDFGDFQDVFLYNNLNQVTRKSSKDGVTNYEYDNRGNLVKETTEGKVTSYEYNGFDNLTKIQNESGYQINRYDSFGNRVNILHNGREKNRILNGSSMIAENNNKGNQMNEFTRGYNILSTTQESTSYYMSSHRGDVYDLVSDDGEVVNKYFLKGCFLQCKTTNTN